MPDTPAALLSDRSGMRLTALLMGIVCLVSSAADALIAEIVQPYAPLSAAQSNEYSDGHEVGVLVSEPKMSKTSVARLVPLVGDWPRRQRVARYRNAV